VARRAETIELAVLGLLHEGPMHGYQLRKRLNLMLGWGRVLSYGSLYPTLKTLLRAGFLEEMPGEATAMTGRPRIVYRVTESGHRDPMGSVRVAIVGVGNCASSLVQGVEYYKHADAAGDRAGPHARAVRRRTTCAT
jgi:hypothetical protein